MGACGPKPGVGARYPSVECREGMVENVVQEGGQLWALGLPRAQCEGAGVDGTWNLQAGEPCESQTWIIHQGAAVEDSPML